MQILYFAWLREKIGTGAEEFSPPPNIATVADLIALLKTRGPGYQAAFANEKLVRCAVDQDFATPATAIAGAKEIAFFPPVTGG